MRNIAKTVLGLIAAALTVACLSISPASADVIGLNNVPTATLVPSGQFVGSVFADTTTVNHVKGSAAVIQLGVGNNAEVAYARGLGSKPTDSYSAEVGGIGVGPLTVSAGILGQNFRTSFNPTYFAVADFNLGLLATVTGGAERYNSTTQGFVGVNVPLNSKVSVVADYLGGNSGAATAGLSVALTDNLTIKPVVKFGNNGGPTTAFTELSVAL